MGGRIAVVDDDPVFLDLLRALLSEEGYEPHLFHDGLEAYPRIRALAPRVILLDVCMEGDPTAKPTAQFSCRRGEECAEST